MSLASYEHGLEKTQANYVPLSPLSFLARAAKISSQKPALVHGERILCWGEVYTRCCQLASALQARGIVRGDTVAVMLPNVPAMYEVHFGVPMLGAVLNTLNTRLDAETIAFMLRHGEARVLLTDREFSPVIKAALRQLDNPDLLVIDVDDELAPAGELLGEIEYEQFLLEGTPDFQWQLPADEWDAISLNYTSGTTGNPKGVVYHHRGAYLNWIANVLSWGMPVHAVYLWTLPMFHCNGWCFPWTMAAVSGLNVCLRRIDPATIFQLIQKHRVTHFCGAPIVHGLLINSAALIPEGFGHPVAALVAGAAPPAAIIEGMERLGVNITHVYGLTDTYGPAAICLKHEEWQALPLAEQARLNGRQGMAYLMEEAMTVCDSTSLEPVPADGKVMG